MYTLMYFKEWNSIDNFSLIRVWYWEWVKPFQYDIVESLGATVNKNKIHLPTELKTATHWFAFSLISQSSAYCFNSGGIRTKNLCFVNFVYTMH